MRTVTSAHLGDPAQEELADFGGTEIPLRDSMRAYVGSGVPVGWKVKIGLEPRIGGYALVGRCSCGYASSRDGGDGAWERTATAVGQHVKDTHLKGFGEWA